MKIICAGLLSSIISTGAYAGGYVAPEITIDPVSESSPSTNWTGFYAGIQLGSGDAELSFAGESESENTSAGGFHVGYTRDFGQVVVGGEFAFDRVTLSDGDEDEGAYLGRLRGRVGYNAGRFMPYVTLGSAALVGEEDSDLSESGFTYGIGAEFLVTERFSLGAEYSRSRFSDVLQDETGVSGLDLDADLVQVRASFRF